MLKALWRKKIVITGKYSFIQITKVKEVEDWLGNEADYMNNLGIKVNFK